MGSCFRNQRFFLSKYFIKADFPNLCLQIIKMKIHSVREIVEIKQADAHIVCLQFVNSLEKENTLDLNSFAAKKKN